MDLVEGVYQITALFPSHEQFGLTSQMRRSAVSIPSNIAEGNRRGTRKDYAHFIAIAYGSTAELETQLEMILRLGYSNREKCNSLLKLLDDVSRMLNRLHQRLTS